VAGARGAILLEFRVAVRDHDAWQSGSRSTFAKEWSLDALRLRVLRLRSWTAFLRLAEQLFEQCRQEPSVLVRQWYRPWRLMNLSTPFRRVVGHPSNPFVPCPSNGSLQAAELR
jgi:hypothetical protein